MFQSSISASLAFFLSASSFANAAVIVPRTYSGDLDGWKMLGCYTDAVGSRTLANAQYLGVDMTQEICTAACFNNGYQYAGVEYANECYCDSQIAPAATLATDGRCNMLCAGNSDELCGGPNGINIYNSTRPVGGNTGEPAPGVNTTAIAPFTYQGCYTDASASGRALAYQQPDSVNMTVEFCVSTCSGLGYSIAGLEYSSQCFCDNYIRYSPTLLADGKCNMPCSGSRGENCGAGNVLSIYSNGTMIDYKPAVIQKTDLPGSWTYKGCLSDVAGSTRSLPYLDTYSNNTNNYCLSLCQQFGYNAGGTEYGEQCFCGDQSDVANAGATLMPESDCNMVCANDTGKNGGYLCGGSNRLSYYTWTGAPLTQWSYAKGNAAGQYKFLISGPVIPLVTTPGRNGKVTYLEKFGTSPANNGTGAYEFDISMVSNYTAAWREMHVKTDVFCSASLTLPDRSGRQINIGGWANDATYGVRLYTPDGKPGVPGVNDWEENYQEVHLQAGRWYPTAMTMANGSILVVGGEEGSNGAPVPSIEVLPSPSKQVLYAEYLDRTDPYNLYPYLAVLPSGDIFVAYYNEARLLDAKTLQTKTVLPNIPGAVNDPKGGRTYPFEGSFMIMPQTYPYTDYMRVMICGGSTPGPEIALDNCVSIAPDQPNANWTIERMPSQRVIPCMVALPDGTYLIMNGGGQGSAGFGLATLPNLNAVLYNPTKPVNTRMTVMANTTIARLYHSEAVLLDDSSVLVSGSDPEDVRAFAPQEYRNEIFTPPYLMGKPKRPVANVTTLDWKYGQTVKFTFTPGSGSIANYRVSLIGAVSSTHGSSMGQRTYFPQTVCGGRTCKVTAPPNANICPPSWFQMYLLDANGIPSNATWVRIGGDPAKLGNWPKFPDFTLPGTGAVKALL